jgi:hypothetical protein
MPMSSAEVDRLLRVAIENTLLISCVYQGLPRIGEPHDYGMRQGKDQLNFFQTGGRSKSAKLDWRTLDVDGITQLRVLEQHFPGTRATPSGRHLQWDRLYATVTPRVQA